MTSHFLKILRLDKGRFCFLITVLSLALSALLRYGFSSVSWDLVTYSLPGIRWVDPSAFQNDWTVDNVVMPHWSFDLVTWLGEWSGHLELIYALYWFAGISALACALTLLNQMINPERPWLSALAGPLIVIGPVSLAGSTTPVLGVAIPHYLGGSLAILALALFARERISQALIAALFSVCVHVQHGFDAAIVLLFGAAFLAGRQRLRTAAAAFLLIVLSLLISRRPGLVGSADDLLHLCRSYIPFHCYAAVWTTREKVIPLILFFLMLAQLAGVLREKRFLAIIALVPVSFLIVGMISDIFSLPLLGNLARMSNVYRFVTLIFPIIALAILRGAASSKAPALAGAITLLAVWCLSPSAHYEHKPVYALVAGLMLMFAAKITGSKGFIASAIATCSAALYFPQPLIRIETGQPPLGTIIQQEVPAGDIIIAAPSHFGLRLLSRRAVIADSKTHPFGGPALKEWETRMHDLGGYDMSSRSFHKLSPDQIDALASKYRARYLILDKRDPKSALAAERWKKTRELPGDLTLFEIPLAPKVVSAGP